MSQSPGTRLGRWRVERLLSRKPHGVVYQVVGDQGERGRAEEIELPPGFSPENEAELRAAVQSLQALQHPSLAPILQLELTGSHAYLFWLETPGFWLQTRVRWSDKPPTYQEVHQWACQALTVAELLFKSGHPLASDSLDPEAWILREDGVLVLVDPGLDRLIWRENLPPDLLASFQAYGRLLESWTKNSQPVATAFSWVIGRCLSERADQNYTDFASLRQSLEERGRVLMTERRIGRTPPLEGFRIPWLDARRQRVTPIVLTAAGLLLIAILAAWSWLSRPLPPRQAAAVAVAAGSRLLVLDQDSGQRLRDLSFASPLTDLAGGGGYLYLARKQAALLEVLDDGTFQARHLTTDGSPDQLELSPDGMWLFVLQKERSSLLVIQCPDQATYLVPVSRYVSRALPAGSSENLLALLSEPQMGALSLILMKEDELVLQSQLPLSGPIELAGGRGWWVAQGTELIRVDASLAPIERLKTGGMVHALSPGLALLENRVLALELPEHPTSGALPGTPTCAARDGQGGFWIGLKDPHLLVHLSSDLTEITHRIELPEPPVGVVWLAARKS
ncbi:hypothetical protein DYH09_06235 [bacterium CPR1]|nr:hypothetical protein [bacterium CPR1]